MTSPRLPATWTLAAIFLAACSSGDGGNAPPAGGRGGDGGAGGSRGSASAGSGGGAGQGGAGGTSGAGGAAGNASGGSGGAAGSGGAGGSRPADVGARDATTGDRGATGEVGARGEALIVVGRVPLQGTDVQIQAALIAQGLTVSALPDLGVNAETTAGKRVVVISYSVESGNVRGKLADVAAPIIVMEHVLLADLGMTSASGHGYQQNVTDIAMNAAATPLHAGLTGDVAVFSQRVGEVFWGTPTAAAINVATVKGNAARSVIFAYPAGAMMATRTAPGKRLQFFFGAHEHTAPMLNPAGLQLLDAAIAWSIQ